MSQVLPNSPSSGLSSELLLNRIQNGDVKSSSGRTVNLGGRLLATSLNGDASAVRLGKQNMEYGYAIASAAQDTATTGRNTLNKVQEMINQAKNTTDLETKKSLYTAAAQSMADMATAATALDINGYKPFSGTVADTLKLSTGFGNEITLTPTGTTFQGQAGWTALSGFLTTASTAATAADMATAEGALTPAVSKTAIDEMLKLEGTYSGYAQDFANQSAIASSVGGLAETAASQQYTSSTGGASGLLGNMLA